MDGYQIYNVILSRLKRFDPKSQSNLHQFIYEKNAILTCFMLSTGISQVLNIQSPPVVVINTDRLCFHQIGQ